MPSAGRNEAGVLDSKFCAEIVFSTDYIFDLSANTCQLTNGAAVLMFGCRLFQIYTDAVRGAE